ncbi:MAG: type II secretion system protein [Patescibacteria group bacterium]
MKGFTLIETLVYAALIATVAGILTLSLLGNISAYNKTEARHNALANATDALGAITNEVKYAKSVYAPTSVFGAAASQLSLETALNAPSGENTTFVDFYLDNGVVYEKREGTAPSALTTARVNIGTLQFSLFTATTTKESVRIEIAGVVNTAAPASTGSRANVHVTSTAALRGAY